jgi:hypothetical protein
MVVRVRGGRRWKLEGEKGGARDRSGLRSEGNDDGESYINGVMVRVIEHGEG